MTQFLIKKFVRDFENVTDNSVREAYGIMVGLVGIICNVLLFGVKLTIGFFSGSISVMADSFNNLSDGASSLVGVLGFKMAGKPPDSEHPFGHGRVEYISALIVSFIIILVGYEFFKTSVVKIFHPAPVVFELAALFFLICTIGIKLWLGAFNKYVGEKIESQVMKAASKDAQNDCVVTGVTIASMLITRFSGLYIDGYAGVVVSGAIIYTGFSVAREILSPLLGEAYDEEMEREIKEKILKYDGVLGCHDLIVHNYGPNRNMASIHVEVPSHVDIEISHEIIDKIERELSQELKLFLVVHMDPVAVNDERLNELRELLNEVLKNRPRIMVHDLRLVDGKERINFIFDMVVPHGLKQREINEIVKEIQREVKAKDIKYECIVNVETEFVNRG